VATGETRTSEGTQVAAQLGARRVVELKLVVAIIAAALLVGCATKWTPPTGTTERQFVRDDYECRQETAHVRGIGPDLRDYSVCLYERCMMARGYAKE
jgi:hypothetical protein